MAEPKGVSQNKIAYLPEVILERDQKRRSLRTHRGTEAMSDAVAAQKKPGPSGSPVFGSLRRCSLSLCRSGHNAIVAPGTDLKSGTPNRQFYSATPPKVNIIIVTYNSRQNLEVCLKSLLGQSYQNYDITISDNGSKDNSPEFVKERFPEVRLIENGSNFGYSEGNNIGVRATDGDYVAVVNNDAEFDRNWLKNLIEVIRTDAGIGAVTSKILFFDDRKKINCLGNTVHFSGLVFCHKIGHPFSEYNEVLEVPATSGAAFVISRKVINRFGYLFDNAYWMSMEDTDLSWRLRMAGYKIMAVPASVVYHKYDLKFTPDKLYHLECGRYLWLFKNYSFQTIFLLLPSFFLTEMVVWTFACLRGWAYIKAKFRSYAWLIRKRRVILQRRKQQQMIRTVNDKIMLRQTVQKIEPNPLISQSKIFKLALNMVNFGYVILFKTAGLFLAKLVWKQNTDGDNKASSLREY